MKKLAIFLILLVLLAAAGLGWLFLSARFEVRFDSCVATDGILQADYLSGLKDQMASDTFVGTVYDSTEIGSPEQYQFLTYAVSVSNHSFLDATAVEIRVTPMQGDILRIGDPYEHTVPAAREETLSVTLLTGRGMQSVREATVSWYIWGIPFTEKITLGN